MDITVLANKKKTYVHKVYADTAYILRTYSERWSIGMDGERESKESVLLTWLDINLSNLH